MRSVSELIDAFEGVSTNLKYVAEHPEAYSDASVTGILREELRSLEEIVEGMELFVEGMAAILRGER